MCQNNHAMANKKKNTQQTLFYTTQSFEPLCIVALSGAFSYDFTAARWVSHAAMLLSQTNPGVVENTM